MPDPLAPWKKLTETGRAAAITLLAALVVIMLARGCIPAHPGAPAPTHAAP